MLLSICAQFTFAQFSSGIPSIHARSSMEAKGDAILILSQPASINRLKSFSAVVYTEKRFLLKELNHSMAAIGLPVSFGGLGLIIQNSGSQELNQNSVGLIYGKNLGKLDLGIRFTYSRLNISGYGTEVTMQYELGSSWQVTDKIQSTVLLSNPFSTAVYRFGLGCKASEKVFASFQVIKEDEKAIDLNISVYYLLVKKIFIQCGIQTQTSSPYWSAGYQLKKLRLESYCSYHPQLGFSPALSLIFSSKEKE
jgi:hypothetical protein